MGNLFLPVTLLPSGLDWCQWILGGPLGFGGGGVVGYCLRSAVCLEGSFAELSIIWRKMLVKKTLEPTMGIA